MGRYGQGGKSGLSTPPAPAKQYYRLRVMIADDAREARRGTRLMLAMHPGVEVVAIAQDGRQAVELAALNKPDIAIMDINMPEMDGITAMQHIRQAVPEVVFIVISGEVDNETIQAATNAGAAMYLLKPFTYEDLDDALRRCARIWLKNRQRAAAPETSASPAAKPATPLSLQEKENLNRLAQEYAQARRTDDTAIAVYEKLASDPNCETRWLVTLAMVYVIRQQWGKLKLLAEHMAARKT